MKRSEHRNIIGDDEPVWERAGARLGGVFIGKMQLVLEDECGPYRRETCLKVWMGQPALAALTLLCTSSSCLRMCGSVFGKAEHVMWYLAMSCGLVPGALPLAVSAPVGCAVSAAEGRSKVGLFAAQGMLSHLAGTTCTPSALQPQLGVWGSS